MNVSELQSLAARRGWQAGPLTFAKIQRMTADESEFHSKLNKEEFERALAEPKTKAESKKVAEQSKVQRFWNNQATEDEVQEASKEIDIFLKMHPQLRVDRQENISALNEWCKTHGLELTQNNLHQALEMLGREGRLTLSPAAVGIIRIRLSNGGIYDIKQEDLSVYQRRNPGLTVLEPETEITGSRLARHTLLDILLSPHSPAIQEKREQAALSAKEYRELNPEAFVQPTPALTEQKFLQATATFLSFHPEYIPTEAHRKHLRAYIDKRKLPYNINSLEAAYAELVREGYIETNSEKVVSAGGGTKLIDLGGEHQPHGTRQNLRVTNNVLADVNRLSAKDYQDALRNPEYRAQVEAALSH
jgi:hypothetical protein